MNLHNKRLIITGGTSGIGYELVRQLHPENNLIIIGRNQKKLDKLSDTFKGLATFKADLSDLKQVEKIADEIGQCYSDIDGIIHNAAVQYTPHFLDKRFKYDSISREIALNFTSVCCLTSTLLPLLRHKERAFILNMGSGLGLVPKTGSAIYCATKGALNIFTQSLRHQLEDTNISVLQAIMPLVDTPMTAGRGTGKMTAEAAAEQIIKGIEKEIPNHDIGKVKLLRLIIRLSPCLAARIIKKG